MIFDENILKIVSNLCKIPTPAHLDARSVHQRYQCDPGER
jgi:hypothetical protein